MEKEKTLGEDTHTVLQLTLAFTLSIMAVIILIASYESYQVKDLSYCEKIEYQINESKTQEHIDVNLQKMENARKSNKCK